MKTAFDDPEIEQRWDNFLDILAKGYKRYQKAKGDD